MKKLPIADKQERVVPFLARYAVPRVDSDQIPGGYCDDQGMWLVDGPSGRVPIIDFNSDLAELTTKTHVQAESDDRAPGALLEVTTKTDANTERDDQQILAGASLEMTTKTAAQLERDDTSPRGLGMW